MLRNIVILIIFAILFQSCSLLDGRKGDERIARVHNNYLYRSDLEGLVPQGTSEADSAVIIERYIDNWIRQQVFLREAEANLKQELVNFERKIRDYRNSLYIFTYENQLVNQKLDTLITDELMQEYYEKHQNEFKLRDNIVRINFVKLPIQSPDIQQVRRLIRSSDPEDLEALEDYCLNHAAAYHLGHDSWFIFTDILREIPINPSNHESYLRNNRFVELNDQYYRYFLYIKEYKLEGSPSPLAFQADNIRAIILNHRRQKLVNEIRQNLFNEAVRSSSFEIF